MSDKVITAWMLRLKHCIPKAFVVTILQMNAGHNTTLHQRHIGKETCLFLIYVRHYFRVLVVISSM